MIFIPTIVFDTYARTSSFSALPEEEQVTYPFTIGTTPGCLVSATQMVVLFPYGASTRPSPFEGISVLNEVYAAPEAPTRRTDTPAAPAPTRR